MASKNARVGKAGFGEDSNILSKFNYSNGAGWRRKKELKIANRGKGQTPGSTKGVECQASTLDRHLAKSSRAYKDKRYSTWLSKTWLNRDRSYREFKEERLNEN